MKSPMFMGDDPVKDAKEKADHIAEVVKHLHEPMHTGFFGGEAETRREDAAWDLGHDLEATSAIPDLVQALNDESSNVRANAAASLWNFANDPKLVEMARVPMQDPQVAAGLRMRFSDSYLRVRLNAARALAARAHRRSTMQTRSPPGGPRMCSCSMRSTTCSRARTWTTP